MSDHDVWRFEGMLIEAGAALQRRDVETYAIRDREFYENVAGQSGNSALIEALAQIALQIQLSGTIANANAEFAERAAHGCDDIIQAFQAGDTLLRAYRSPAIK
jgi:DNA-binding GntR family transcriptional regulator